MVIDECNSEFYQQYHSLNSKYQKNTLSSEELNKWHYDCLKKVLAHVNDKSIFYKKHLANVNLDEVTLDNFHELAPFTTKGNLREAMSDIICGEFSDAIYYYETTGTTGNATPCPRDKKESYISNKQLQISYKAIIDKEFSNAKRPFFDLLGPAELHSFADTLTNTCFNLDIASVKFWPASPSVGYDRALRLMQQLKISAIACSTTESLALARQAIKRGLNPKTDFNVKIFMLSCEVCTPALFANIQSVWGATPYNCCSGLIEPDTQLRDNNHHLIGYHYEQKETKLHTRI